MTYGSQIWGQGIKTYTDKIQTIQNTALRIISFADFNAEINQLYNNHKILKIHDQITLQNCLFIHDYLNNKLPSSFNNTFCKVNQIHEIPTRNSTMGSLFIPHINTTKYGLNSIYRKSIEAWNYFIKENKNINIGDVSRTKLKTIIIDHFVHLYEN